MNEFVRWGIVLTLACVCYGCRNETRLEKALEDAGDNRLELLKVIDHYKNTDNRDSLKLEAALFLIENMRGHGSIWSEAIEDFRQKVNASDTLLTMEPIAEWWNRLKENNRTVFKADLEHLKADFLIQNIDGAFRAWQLAPWKKEVDFEIFCNYILPYRFETELLADGWRDSLYNEFYTYVKETKTVKEAYEIVHDVVWKQLLSSSSPFPYVIDVLAMRHQRKAMCIQRCVMLGSVMRALGIPAAIDNVGRWANYSDNSHAWTALVTKKGTYSVFEDEQVAKINNRIDATIFEVNYPIAEDYPLATDFKKRCFKVWRSTFYRHEIMENEALDWTPIRQYVSPFTVDVSKEYGFAGEVDVYTDKKDLPYAYLCTFSVEKGWAPVCYEYMENGRCRFTALGDSVLYLTMGYQKGKPIPLEPPFLLLGGKKISLVADTVKRETIVLNRKYPLTGKWMNKWAPMVGMRFEGSNEPDFKSAERLCSIDSMPVFYNELSVKNTKPFRYIRCVAPEDCEGVLAEVLFKGENGELPVTPGRSSVGKVDLSLDRNALTRPDYEKGFFLGYDLGEPHRITSIAYLPWNDDNFVLPGHDYELFYYDGGWVSLGKQKAEYFSLVYKNVPINALLCLQDYTRGKEVRPFTYVDGKQVWW